MKDKRERSNFVAEETQLHTEKEIVPSLNKTNANSYTLHLTKLKFAKSSTLHRPNQIAF